MLKRLICFAKVRYCFVIKTTMVKEIECVLCYKASPLLLAYKPFFDNLSVLINL